MTDWYPIETAPIRQFEPDNWFMSHSDRLLAWNGYYCEIVDYHYTQRGKGKWHANGRIVSGWTHWMPLPKGPTISAGESR